MDKVVLSGSLLILLVHLCSSDQPASAYSPQPSYGHASYQYQWRVKDDYSKNDYGQDEKSDAGRTSGSYYVQLPDGRLQKVTYTVNGDEGFKADVTYEGEARVSYQQPSSYQTNPAPAPVRSPVPSPAPQITYPQPQPAAPAPRAPASNPTPPQPSPSSSYKPGEVYYKPIENTPAPEVYYKPVPQASEPAVYYKPLPSGS